MKNALLYILCGITVAITEQYESNSTLLEGKLTSGRRLAYELYIFGDRLASIQIEEEHFCTGFAYDTLRFAIMTTAKCAQRVSAFLSHPLPERPPIRVCSWDLQTIYHCSKVIDVGINKIFYQHEKNEDFTPENSAFLKIVGIMTAAGSKRLPDAKIPLEPKNKVTVVGHKFSRRDSIQHVNEVTYAEALVLDYEQCTSIFNVNLDETPIFRSGACIQICMEDVKFQEGNEGSPVFFNWKWIGIVAEIACDMKTAYIVRPRTSNPLDYRWISMNDDTVRL